MDNQKSKIWNVQMSRYVWLFEAHAISTVLIKFRFYCGFKEIPSNYGNSLRGYQWGQVWYHKLWKGYSIKHCYAVFIS